MPNFREVLLQPQTVLRHQVVPGTTFELRFVNPAVADWRLYHFISRVKTLDDVLQFEISSADDEISVTQSAAEIAAEGDNWQQINVVMSAAKTALLAELTEFKYDIMAELIADDSIVYPVWPYARLMTIERVT